MHQIDFLPEEYRQNRVQRQSKTWRMIVLVVCGALLVATALGQHRRRRQLEAELAAVTPEHEAALAQNQHLSELQSQLDLARCDAELFTYLRYPWPRTQIIDALLAGLPEDIVFEQFEIYEQAPSGRAPVEQLSRSERDAREKEFASLPPAAGDLKGLRAQFDLRRTLVTVSGWAGESASLHRYLGELGRNDLFTDVDFSIEADKGGHNATLRFSATITVRPGYGQVGGPHRQQPLPGAKPRRDNDNTV